MPVSIVHEKEFEMGKVILAGLIVLMAIAAVLMGDSLAAEVPVDSLKFLL